MKPGHLRNVRSLLVVEVPESPSQAVHQAHRRLGEFISRGNQAQFVEFAVEPHKADVVISLRRFLELRSELREYIALLRRSTLGSASANQPLDLPARP